MYMYIYFTSVKVMHNTKYCLSEEFLGPRWQSSLRFQVSGWYFPETSAFRRIYSLRATILRSALGSFRFQGTRLSKMSNILKAVVSLLPIFEEISLIEPNLWSHLQRILILYCLPKAMMQDGLQANCWQVIFWCVNKLKRDYRHKWL